MNLKWKIKFITLVPGTIYTHTLFFFVKCHTRFWKSTITVESILSIVISLGKFFTEVVSYCLPLKGSDYGRGWTRASLIRRHALYSITTQPTRLPHLYYVYILCLFKLSRGQPHWFLFMNQQLCFSEQDKIFSIKFYEGNIFGSLNKRTNFHHRIHFGRFTILFS